MPTPRKTTFPFLQGTDVPRLILISATNVYQSTGTETYSAGPPITVSETGSPDFSDIRPGMRITSTATSGLLSDEPTYARITKVDDPGDILTLDAWVPAQPANSTQFTVNGWVMDIFNPKKGGLKQTFTPNQLVHKLFRGRRETKHFGWDYRAVLDYSDHIFDDFLIEIRTALSQIATDQLVFIPHKDKSGFNYNVHIDAPTTLAPFGKTSGHSGVIFTFSGKDKVADFPLPSAGYGFNYGFDYGTGL